MDFTIINVLGETRPVDKLYAWEQDGVSHTAYNCPFCGAAVTTERNMIACENPWCSANPAMPVEAAQKKADQAAEYAREEADRKRNHEQAMERIREDQDRRVRAYQDFVMRVRAANGCLKCSSEYHNKVRKHRNECPKQAA